MRRRYYICDNKLGTLGWKERTRWEDGLRRTVEWYLEHGFQAFWDNGDVEAALQPHPIIHPQVGSAMALPGLQVLLCLAASMMSWPAVCLQGWWGCPCSCAAWALL